MLKEFKAFALKGNVLDLAVGVIIGGAFGKIVTSFVNDITMPIISLFTGKVNFNDLFITFGGHHYKTLDEAKKAGASTLNYGAFITNVIDFVIIAFVIFIFIKQIEKLHKKPEAAVSTKECPYCKTNVHLEATRCPNCTSSLI